MIEKFDVIIVGSGAAAYSAADWLYKAGIHNIVMLTENRFFGTSRNTGSDKQTYYKLSMDGKTDDSPYRMAKDICSLGSCDGVKAYLQAVNSTKCFLRLCEYGVEFPTDEYGAYPGYRTDHDDTVRATSVGPLTSKVITEKLEDVVLYKNKTPVFSNCQIIEIITHNGKAQGVAVLNTVTEEIEIFTAESIICATGAPACIYEHSVYPESQHGMTGILIESGVRLCNYSQWQYGLSSTDFRWNVSGSFMQVIPRFVSIDENGNEDEFLPRYFADCHDANNHVFLKGYQWPFSYDRIDKSSRVDIAVHEEIKKGRTVYLDFTKNPSGFEYGMLSDETEEYIRKTDCMAPTPFERLEKLNSKAIEVYMNHGIDLRCDKLKIAVCAQHNNGGVYTDRNYQTDIDGLYVIGEAAGSFGLTRPGGSALNDTQVGGLVCTDHIKNKKASLINESLLCAKEEEYRQLLTSFVKDASTDYSYIKKEMSIVASFIRDEEKCASLLEKISNLLENLPFRHKSVSHFFHDKDMLISVKALLETILGEMTKTGSRGGSIFTKGGKITAEDTSYRKYLTVTENGSVYFEKASDIPVTDMPFEYYLNRIP